jgi:hypothetical protein
VTLSRPLLGGLAALGAAGLLPVLLWHRAIGLVASDFRLELDYLVTGWTGYGLIATGLLVMLWATLSNPRARKAYVGWGVSLYLLGAILASQIGIAVAAIP